MSTTAVETSIRERAIEAFKEERDKTREHSVNLARALAGRIGLELGDPLWRDDVTYAIFEPSGLQCEIGWFEFKRKDKTTERTFCVLERCANCDLPHAVLAFASLPELGEVLDRIDRDDLPEWECIKCAPKKDAQTA